MQKCVHFRTPNVHIRTRMNSEYLAVLFQCVDYQVVDKVGTPVVLNVLKKSPDVLSHIEAAGSRQLKQISPTVNFLVDGERYKVDR